MSILNKNNLRNSVQDNIYENTEQKITGDILQNVLVNIVDSTMNLQDDEKWKIDNGNIEIKNGSLNINLKDKGFIDNNIISNNENAIKLTDNNNFIINTTNKTIVGAINELKNNTIYIQNNYALKNLSNVDANIVLSKLNNASGDILINTTLFDNFKGQNYKKIVYMSGLAMSSNTGKWNKIAKLKYTYDNSDRINLYINISNFGGYLSFERLSILLYHYYNSSSNIHHHLIKEMFKNSSSIIAFGISNDNYLCIKTKDTTSYTGPYHIEIEMPVSNSNYPYIIDEAEYSNETYNNNRIFNYKNVNGNELTDSDMDFIFDLQIYSDGYWEFEQKNATVITNDGIPSNPRLGNILYDTNDNKIKINFPNIGWKTISTKEIRDTDGNTYLTVEPTSSASNYALLKVPHTSTHVAFRVQNSNNDNSLNLTSEGILSVLKEIKTPKLNHIDNTENLIIGDNSNKVVIDNLTKLGGLQYDYYDSWYSWGNIRTRIPVNSSTGKNYSSGDYAIYNIEKNKTYLYYRDINLIDSTYSEGAIIVFPNIYTDLARYRVFIERLYIGGWPQDKYFMAGYLRYNIDIFEYGTEKISENHIIHEHYHYYIKFRINGGNSIDLNNNYMIDLHNINFDNNFKIIRKIIWGAADVFENSKLVAIRTENDYYIARFNYWTESSQEPTNSISATGHLYLLHHYYYGNYNTKNWSTGVYWTLGMSHSGGYYTKML